MIPHDVCSMSVENILSDILKLLLYGICYTTFMITCIIYMEGVGVGVASDSSARAS